MTDLNNLQVTMADVQVLLQQNPLFAEQIKSIILTRLLREQDKKYADLEAELQALRNRVGYEDGSSDQKIANTEKVTNAS